MVNSPIPSKLRLLAGILAVAAIGMAAFAAVRAVGGRGMASPIEPDSSPVPATPYPTPSDTEHPISGTTPDTSKPGWYVPFLNADRDAPKFDGQIGNIKIGPWRDGEPDPSRCEGAKGLVGDAAQLAASSGLLGINFAAMPAGVRGNGSPLVTLCADGVRMVHQLFQVDAGTRGANSGGGSVDVLRLAEGDRVGVSAPRSRWSSGVFSGHEAVFLRPVVESPVELTIGESAVAFIVESATGKSLTIVVGRSVSLDLVQAIAAAVIK